MAGLPQGAYAQKLVPGEVQVDVPVTKKAADSSQGPEAPALGYCSRAVHASVDGASDST
jgi:hypothetical protein